MPEFYLGLMSGTSADGIDAALVDFSSDYPKLHASYYSPYSRELRERIHGLLSVSGNQIHALGELDIILGKEFAKAANALLASEHLSSKDIQAIGSHGQTIYHYPKPPFPYTLQIGDPNIIAAETGITTIADFRRKDMAYGGQGAPLVPAFHQYILGSEEKNRAVVNIGGIANVTLLANDLTEPVIGFDTGPGNVLLDSWINKHQKLAHDEKGKWAAEGKVNGPLLKKLLADPYFILPAPKSTGREYFHLSWLQNNLVDEKIAAEDVQATLTELTAQSILMVIKNYFSTAEILICGGGVHNTHLMNRLSQLAAPNFPVDSTARYGLAPDWIEAMAFAWLAKQTLNKQHGNLPSVTGAMQKAILGGVYYN